MKLLLKLFLKKVSNSWCPSRDTEAVQAVNFGRFWSPSFRTCSKFLDRPEIPNKASRVRILGIPTNLSSILASVNRVPPSFCDFACVFRILQLSNPSYFQSFVKTTTFFAPPRRRLFAQVLTRLSVPATTPSWLRSLRAIKVCVSLLLPVAKRDTLSFVKTTTF